MQTNDPVFFQIYNDEILQRLQEKFGPFHQQHAEVTAGTEIMQRMFRKMEDRHRRGEVVMVLPDADGHIWLHTKDFYPDGIYRLLTGGLEGKEAPEQAMVRETIEETGFKTKIDRCLAVITYNIAGIGGNGPTLPFVSYVFVSYPVQGRPVVHDPNETISHFTAVPPASLTDTARQLRALSGDFADWGVFRAIAHQVVAEQWPQVSSTT